jgi:hypothetical protein
MKYGRIINNVVVEVFTPPPGVRIEDCFHPDVGFEEIPPNAQLHWIKDESGVLVAPPEPEAPTEPAPTA